MLTSCQFGTIKSKGKLNFTFLKTLMNQGITLQLFTDKSKATEPNKTSNTESINIEYKAQTCFTFKMSLYKMLLGTYQ